MRDVEILADLAQRLAADVRAEIAALSPEELAWRPDPEANSMGITVWHFSRWLDLLVVRALENRPAEEEQWHTRGWAARTGYDPRGIGYQGLGAITGYTQEEVAAIPVLSATELLTYLEHVCTALQQYLLAQEPDGLYQPALGFESRRTVYEWIKGPLLGSFGHLGEIEALKAMHARQQRMLAA
jgi:hypothetical protein